jgi:hypothetical protein
VTRKLASQLVLAVFALALMLAPVATVLATNVGSGYHWGRKTSQFTLQVGDNVGGGWDKFLSDALKDWNKNGTVTLKEVGGKTGTQNCNPTEGMVEVCNFNYGTQQGWLGLTRLFFNDKGDHVDSATVQLNDSFFEQNNGQYNSDAARRHTICHELGHTIGLDHVGNGSCMNDSPSAVFNNLKPINKDFNELERIYDHKDSSVTVGGTQKKQKNKKQKDKKQNEKGDEKKNKKNKQDKGDDKDNKRKKHRKRTTAESFFDPTSLPAVPSGLDSAETEIVQTLDDGGTVITFITWAEE